MWKYRTNYYTIIKKIKNIPKQQGHKRSWQISQSIDPVPKTNVQSQSKTKNKNQSN